MVLGKLPVPGRPTILITVGQGPTAPTVDAALITFFAFISDAFGYPRLAFGYPRLSQC